MDKKERQKLTPIDRANLFKEDNTKLFDGKYTYDKITELYSSHDKVECYCTVHNKYFIQEARRHSRGCIGCKECLSESKTRVPKIDKSEIKLPKLKSGKDFSLSEWIRRAKLVHGDKYDYSKVEYVNNIIKICIICPTHGEFWQSPNGHLQGKGCIKCSGTYQKTTDDFIKEANLIHDNFYTYEKTNYINSTTKVIITCPIHGDFEQLPSNHLKRNGCPHCKGGIKYSKSFWVETAKEKYGDLYDYSLTDYINQRTHIQYKCNECGEVITQTPNNHMAYGCPNCSRLKIGTPREEFIEKAKEVHCDKFDYSLITEPILFLKDKVQIICKKHGIFEQCGGEHLRGAQCIKCANNVMTHDELTEKFKSIHGNRYDYSKVEYNGYNEKVCIVCPTHGEFWQTPHAHINGKGCPVCKQSHIENEIMMLLMKNNIEFEPQKRFEWLGLQSLDFFLPQHNVGIECQGEQHFKETRFGGGDPTERLIKCKERDALKKKLCVENGVKLLYYSNLGIEYPYHIFEDKNELINEIKNH